MFSDIYSHRNVLITGHTGFKGSWLACWLERLHANILGISLPMQGPYVHADLLNLAIRSQTLDIRNRDALVQAIREFRPEIIFHLAAQPLVRISYQQPLLTFETNVIGTANLLEAARLTDSVRAVVAITSDKCYENREDSHPFRESDPMGGYDPYSASKGCAELVIASYRRSFFNSDSAPLIASCRAGNVIGGGDWAQDRLIPDLVRAAAQKRPANIRNPEAVRPWQHVLEPLSGYLALGQKLLQGERSFADAWNFGPADDAAITVRKAAEAMTSEWPDIQLDFPPQSNAPHEATMLRLDSSKAENLLHWHGVWTPQKAFRQTAAWYRDFYTNNSVRTSYDIDEYIQDATKENLQWTK